MVKNTIQAIMARSPVAQVAYDGESLRDGSMDVRDLAPALLAIGDLLQNANYVLNGDRASLAVKVRSDFETGSFEIFFDLIQSLSSQAHMFITGEQLKTVKEIAELVGLAGGSIIGVLKLFKLIKGERPISGTTLQNGNIEVHIHGSNNNVEIKPEVLALANNPQVQKAAAEVMKPLESVGVEKFEVRKGKQVIETFTREDLPAFSAPKPVEQELKDVDKERIVALEVIKPSFLDDLTWVFSDGSGGRIGAIMQDEKFRKRLEKREISFTKGDILKLRLRSRSYLTDGSLRTENKVVEVLDVISLPKSMPLLPAVEIEQKLLPDKSTVKGKTRKHR